MTNETELKVVSKEELAASANGKQDEPPLFVLEFDQRKVRALSAIEVAKYIALSSNFAAAPIETVEMIAAMLAKTVKSCPKSWGAPNDPGTYLKLSWFVEFPEAAKQLGKAINEYAKN